MSERVTTSADVLGFIVQACRRLRGVESCLCGMHGGAGVVIADPTLAEWGAIQATGKELEWNLFALRQRIVGDRPPWLGYDGPSEPFDINDEPDEPLPFGRGFL